MENKLIVFNNLRVGNFIGTKIKHDENLFLSNDGKVKDFIDKYYKYLDSCEEDDILKLFELTGIIIGHEYIDKNTFKRIYFTSNGPYSYDYEEMENKPKAYNNHLVMETYVDNLEVFKTCITVQKDIIYKFKNKVVQNTDIDRFNIYIKNLRERIEYLKEKKYLFPNSEKIKDILLDSLNNVISLMNNGDLYINNLLYTTGVKYIFDFNDTDIKLIFENNLIEEYSNHYNGLFSDKCDKVLYDDNFLAILKENKLELYVIVEISCLKMVHLHFTDVDNIEYEMDNKNLVIIKGNEKIKLALFSIMV